MPWPPKTYAEAYYQHYPKVALGHWPPLFYVVQAVWTLVLPPGRVSIALLLACLTAAAATWLAHLCQPMVGLAGGIAAALVYLTLPAVVESTGAEMAESLLTLLVLAAVVSYGRYLDGERWQDSAAFGVLAALALLTKGSAALLVFVPPLAVALAGRWDLMRTISFWLPAPIVAALAGPWYVLAPGARHEGVAPFGGLAFHASRLISTWTAWESFLGPAITLAAGCGLWAIIRRRPTGVWASGLALVGGAFLIRLVIGAWEDRHLLITLPVLLMLAAAGGREVLVMLPGQWRTWAGAAVVVLVCGVHLSALPVKRRYGYIELAQRLVSDPTAKDQVILSCADSTAEGMLIAEVATAERRPGHRILRGSKVLVETDWMGYRYRSLYADEEDAIRYLESVPVGLIVVDHRGAPTPYCGQLAAALDLHPGRWRKESGGANGLFIYRAAR